MRRRMWSVATVLSVTLCLVAGLSTPVAASVAHRAGPSWATGGTYRGMTDTGAPMLLVVGGDGLSVQRLAFGHNIVGGAPMPRTSAEVPPAFVTVTCIRGTATFSQSLVNADLPVAGLPIVDDGFWSSGPEGRVSWVVEGWLQDDTATGVYTHAVADCGETRVAWTAQRQ
jgi:hypothetical protein